MFDVWLFNFCASMNCIMGMSGFPSCKSLDMHGAVQNAYRKPFKKSVMLFSNIATKHDPPSHGPKLTAVIQEHR